VKFLKKITTGIANISKRLVFRITANSINYFDKLLGGMITDIINKNSKQSKSKVNENLDSKVENKNSKKIIVFVISILFAIGGYYYWYQDTNFNLVKNKEKIKAEYQNVSKTIEEADKQILKLKLDAKAKRLGINFYHHVKKNNIVDYGQTSLSKKTDFISTKSKKLITLKKGTELILLKRPDKVFYLYQKKHLLEKKGD